MHLSLREKETRHVLVNLIFLRVKPFSYIERSTRSWNPQFWYDQIIRARYLYIESDVTAVGVSSSTIHNFVSIYANSCFVLLNVNGKLVLVRPMFTDRR